MRIAPGTLRAVQALAGQRDGADHVDVLCTVDCGPACRLIDGDWSDVRLRAIAPRLIDDVGYKIIEHAAGASAVIRVALSRAECRIDLGDGFRPLEVAND